MGADFGICIQYLKKKLISNDKLDGFEKEQDELLHIIKKTIDFGESDSVVILGPNGCGKSLVPNINKIFFYMFVFLSSLMYTFSYIYS